MKTLIAILVLALTALVPAGSAESPADPQVDANPCDSGFGAFAGVGDLCVDTTPTWCTVWIEWIAIPSPPTCLVAPLAAATPMHTIDPIFPKCVTAWDFPDEGLVVCADPRQAECPVYADHTTFIGTQRFCVDPTPGVPSSASVECMDVYGRTNVGTYSIVRRDSCSAPEAYQCPYENAPIDQCEDLLALRASASGPDCYPVYSRTDVGTYSIVRRSSCAVPEVYQCPYEGAPLADCEPVTDGLLRPSAASSEPMCMDYNYEVEVGPVRHVQRDSCHSENYVCGVPLAEFLASTPDPAALAQCTVDSLGVA